jgi:ribose transport system permease protein
MSDSILNIILITLVSFAVIIAIGAFNGTLIGSAGLPPLITTFGTSGIVLGTAILLMPVPGGYVPKFFYKLYSSSILNYIPFPLIILAIGIIFWIIISRTAVYRYIYAIGSNEDGAYAAGIKVGNVRLMAHIIAGFFVGLAGLCLLLLTATGEYRSGIAYALNSVAAVVIGGISLKGGKGNIWGAIIGAITLGLLNNIIFFASVSSFYQDFAKGMIIILSLSIAAIPRVRAERNRI